MRNHVLYYIVSNAKSHEEELKSHLRSSEQGDQEQAIRNLSNAWRDEFAVNDPIEGTPEDRMRTAEWRISMAYYAIYKAFSVLMRSKFDAMLNGRGKAY